jgi:hypothetical protein
MTTRDSVDSLQSTCCRRHHLGYTLRYMFTYTAVVRHIELCTAYPSVNRTEHLTTWYTAHTIGIVHVYNTGNGHLVSRGVVYSSMWLV